MATAPQPTKLEQLVQKTKKFLATDGQVTGRGLLTSTALGGFYLGLPLYLGFQKRSTIRKTIGDMQKSVADQISAYKTHAKKTDLSLTEKFVALNTRKTWKTAGTFALAAGLLTGANHFLSFENPNYNRLSHFGPGLGIFGNAAAQAAKKARADDDTFWSAFRGHLWYKTTDLGEETVKGAKMTAEKTVELAKATGNGAVYIASQFADDNDQESKAVNMAKPLSDKFVAVCVNRSDYSRSVKDAGGKVTWEKKTGPQADTDNKKIPAYLKRMNETAESFKKPDSAFRKALSESASGLMIIEPGYIKDDVPVTFTPMKASKETVCPENTRESRYNAEAYLSSRNQGHLPPDPLP